MRIAYIAIALTVLACERDDSCELTATCPPDNAREAGVHDAGGESPQAARMTGSAEVVEASETGSDNAPERHTIEAGSPAGVDAPEPSESDGVEVPDFAAPPIPTLSPAVPDEEATPDAGLAEASDSTDASVTGLDGGESDAECDAAGCAGPASLGDGCRLDADCSSGYCVGGLCCNRRCEGQCETCASPETLGVCQIVEGPTPEGKPACDGIGACAGSCDGVAAGCIFPGNSMVCTEAQCVDGIASSTAFCDGQGECMAPNLNECGSYECSDTACRTDCQHDGHCTGDAMCFDGMCRTFAQKQVTITSTTFSPGGGIGAADAMCQEEFGGTGSSWKALLVGGSRTASLTPFLGDGQQDWVLAPFTEYYNWEGRLMWVTEEVALLGVRDGQRAPLEVSAWDETAPGGGIYPWSGYADDWTTRPDETCEGWTSDNALSLGSFAFQDLTHAAQEPCSGAQFLMCVEQ